MNVMSVPPHVSARYRTALADVLPGLPAFQLTVLRTLRDAPEHTLSAGLICRQLGGKHAVTINNALANAGLAVLGGMGLPAEEAVQLFPRPWHILAMKAAPGLGKGFPWQLRPEVVEALGELEVQALETDRLELDERTGHAPLTEADESKISMEVRRRNLRARELCLAANSPPTCRVCGLDFAQIYGAEFSECLHVHHLNPMAMALGQRDVDPAIDLVPVCPNCHAVIHAGGTLRSIEAVQALLLHAKASSNRKT